MEIHQLNLPPGSWLLADCSKMPSEKNCQLVMLAPAAQRSDLVEAGVAHAIKSHGHTDSPDLRDGVDKLFETITIE